MLAILTRSLRVMAQSGSWEDAGESGVVCIHTALLPNNHVLCMERPHQSPYPINTNTNTYLTTDINLHGRKNANGAFVSNFTALQLLTNPFCGHHVILPDGSIFVVGGDLSFSRQGGPSGEDFSYDGRRGLRIFEPCVDSTCSAGKWNDKGQMSTERWYPTAVTLADESVIVIGGFTENLDFSKLGNTNNPTYEYYPPKPGQWPRNLDILSWCYPLCLYPQSFQLPSGNVFVLVSNKTITINPADDTLGFNIPDLPATDHQPWIYPYTPVMTMLPLTIANNWTATLQICGGTKRSSSQASEQCFQISPDDPNPKWKQIENLPVARVMPDCIILPGNNF
jgi:hypothetical protein